MRFAGAPEDAALRIPRRRIAAELVDRAFIDELRREVAIEVIPENTGIGAIEFADEDIKKAVWDQWKRQRDQEIDWQLLPGASRMQADRMLTMYHYLFINFFVPMIRLSPDITRIYVPGTVADRSNSL